MLALLLLTAASGVHAALPAPADEAPGGAQATEALFPRPAMLEPAVQFWTRVFGEYSQFQSVIHSQDEPGKVYMVLDFRDEAAELGEEKARRLQGKAERAVKKELDAHLREAHANRNHRERLNPIQQRVYDLFADSADPDRYKNAIGRFRAQRGLRELTHRALEVSGRYLPRMEQIFEEEGLPVVLTRLPIVESSFRTDVYSKVGAAGLWQFIPSSARIYMRLDEAVDDRRDPWTATRGAARHLKADYEKLQDWPLAITAYNHGRASLARGLRQVKGESLFDLIERWDGRRFGFASKNFYAEFLAAVEVERKHRDYFGEITRHDPIEFDTVETIDYVPYSTLARISGTDEETFRMLNPGYRPEVLDGRLYVPPRSTIRVPAGRHSAFRNVYASLGSDERFSQQRFYYVRYKVRSGDNLGSIARRYGVKVSTLQQVNGIRNPKLLRIGKILRIPPRGGARAVTVARQAPNPDGSTIHRVRPGQSLSTIARQYRTSIKAIMQVNGLRNAHFLRTGQVLKIPSG